MTTTPDPVDVVAVALDESEAAYWHRCIYPRTRKKSPYGTKGPILGGDLIDPDVPEIARVAVAALSEHFILVPRDGPLPDDLLNVVLRRAVETLRPEVWTPSEGTDGDER